MVMFARMVISLVFYPDWYGLILSYGFGLSFSNVSKLLATELRSYAGLQTKSLY